MNPAIFLPIINLPLHSFAPMHAAEDPLSFPLFSLWTQLFFCLITKYGNSPDIPLPTSIFTNTILNHPFPFFNLLQSGFYFLYKFPSSLKALLPSFGEVFLVWSFCLFLQLSVHSEFWELLSSCGNDTSFFRTFKFFSLPLPKEWKRQPGEQQGTDSATPWEWDIKSCIPSRGGKHGREKTERQR